MLGKHSRLLRSTVIVDALLLMIHRWIISRSEGAMGPATANTTGMGTATGPGVGATGAGPGVGATGAGYGTGLKEKALGTTAPTMGATATTAPAAGVGPRTV